MQQPIDTVSTIPLPDRPRETVNPIWALRMFWISVWTLVISTTIGLTWDRGWHATHVFDTFYSPPHFFIYSTTILTILLVSGITFTPRLRAAFGPGFRFPLLSFELPGALFITGSGLATLGLAGILDDLWHSTFGLDETGWSTPHSMLGWGWFVTMLGFVACRLALRRYKPLRWYTTILLGFLILGFSAIPFMGPFHGNYTPEMVHAVSRIRVLTFEPPVQHTFRIYLAWNLTRTNPLFILLATFWAGTILTVLRGLEKRASIFLIVPLISTLLSGNLTAARSLLHTQHPTIANWFPLPLFVAALAFVLLLKIGLSERWAWAIAGEVLSWSIFLIWGSHAPLAAICAILAGPIMVLGSFIGTRIYRVLENPTQGASWRLVLIVSMQMPAITGIIDLILRKMTA